MTSEEHFLKAEQAIYVIKFASSVEPILRHYHSIVEMARKAAEQAGIGAATAQSLAGIKAAAADAIAQCRVDLPLSKRPELDALIAGLAQCDADTVQLAIRESEALNAGVVNGRSVKADVEPREPGEGSVRFSQAGLMDLYDFQMQLEIAAKFLRIAEHCDRAWQPIDDSTQTFVGGLSDCPSDPAERDITADDLRTTARRMSERCFEQLSQIDPEQAQWLLEQIDPNDMAVLSRVRN